MLTGNSKKLKPRDKFWNFFTQQCEVLNKGQNSKYVSVMRRLLDDEKSWSSDFIMHQMLKPSFRSSFNVKTNSISYPASVFLTICLPDVLNASSSLLFNPTNFYLCKNIVGVGHRVAVLRWEVIDELLMKRLLEASVLIHWGPDDSIIAAGTQLKKTCTG